MSPTPLRAADVSAAMEQLNASFSPCDINRDGTPEIRWVRELGISCEPTSGRRGLVVVLVEPRLLTGLGVMSPVEATPLWAALHSFVFDLTAEGWGARVVAMQVYDGPVHQDGRTVLAMREWLRGLRRLTPDLAGVVIVGSFPEAMLVRQYNWRQRCPTSVLRADGTREDFGGREVCRLRSRAEVVAMRCELVLADLDGNWEQLYHIGPERLPWVTAVYPDAAPPEGQSPESEWPLEGPTAYVETGFDEFEDFFFVNDGRYELTRLADGRVNLELHDAQRDDECSAADRERGNPMARPDILVSRLNARHIALRPKASVRGVGGEGLLNEVGRPQVVTFADEATTPRGLSVWEPDPQLERRLLLEYFERNHRYRRGAFEDHCLPAAASFGLGSFMDSLKASRPQWASFAEPGYDLQGDDADLTAVVEWLKRPAVLRAIAAHSDPWGCNFKECADPAALEAACGGQSWSWIKEGNRLVPSLGRTGKLDYAIMRTLWENRALPDSACFYLHSGCEAISPGGVMHAPYNSPDYAYWQGAEGLLFLCQGLALVGRAKVFYDFPTDFDRQLGAGKTFGEAWAHYFEVESAESNLENVGGGIGRKRAYFWSVLGDWTLTLQVPEQSGE